MNKNAIAEHQHFLNQTKNASPETQNASRKNKMTPFQTELTRDRHGAKKKYSNNEG